MFLKAGQPLALSLTLAPDVVAVGTRRLDRSGSDAIAPVDVIEMRQPALTGAYTDNTQLLNYVVPSFNTNRETSADGADHVDAFNLRGLGVDQVLVLVNGHRRHSSALVNLLGSRSLGSSPTDLNTISANALDRVEILRDAQYGSDAIAGVMNLTLKSADYGGNVLVNNGIHAGGYGYTTGLSINKGLKLGQKGFLNLTGDVDYRNFTTTDGYNRDLSS
ncbi:MAG: TonB-dependent receptor plug domain-containing protein [Bacteroidota bacterium]|nr:TonB-dependent receptor plug domain-containing protein [Bacteroidota bacterium]